MSKLTPRGQVWKSKTHMFVLGLRSHFLNTALAAHLSPKHCLNMARRVTAENNLLVRTRGMGPNDKAYEGRDTKDSLADL